MNQRLSPEDMQLVLKLFGTDLKGLTQEKFKELLKEARKKYHPDKFSKFEDEVVQEMAKERFQQIEILAGKITEYLETRKSLDEDPLPPETIDPTIVYVSKGMKIDIMTRERMLKYQLFGRRIIYRGDKVKIPGTKASLVALEDYSPRIQAGFRDNIKVLLMFGETSDVREIVHWLFRHINGRTSSFVIEGKLIKVDPYEMLKAIRMESRLELGGGEAQ
ncbi:MAG: hypothetical protein AAF587_17790 [Bacteroidota bacterium]